MPKQVFGHYNLETVWFSYANCIQTTEEPRHMDGGQAAADRRRVAGGRVGGWRPGGGGPRANSGGCNRQNTYYIL